MKCYELFQVKSETSLERLTPYQYIGTVHHDSHEQALSLSSELLKVPSECLELVYLKYAHEVTYPQVTKDYIGTPLTSPLISSWVEQDDRGDSLYNGDEDILSWSSPISEETPQQSTEETPLTPETAHVCSGCPEGWCKGCIPDESLLEAEEDPNPLELAQTAASETQTEETLPSYDMLLMPVEVPYGEGYMVYTLPVKISPEGEYSCRGLSETQLERLSSYLKESESAHPRTGKGSRLMVATAEESRLYALLVDSLKTEEQLRRERVERYVLESHGTLKGYEPYIIGLERVDPSYPDREDYEAEGTLLPDEGMYTLSVFDERYPYQGSLYGPYLRAYYDVKVSAEGELSLLSSWCILRERQLGIEEDERD